jgi:hypothetical protein
MHVARKLFLPGALVAAAALLTAGAYSPAQSSDGVSLVSSVQSADAGQLRSTLQPLSAYPAGTTLTQYTVSQAVSANLLKAPATVVVSPAACSNLLTSFVGDLNKFQGWVQRGTTPNKHRADNVVGTVAGGANLNGVLADVAACKTGTVSVPSLGLTGKISLSTFPAATVKGAQAVGVQQTVSFPGNSSALANQFAAAGSSAQVYSVQGDNAAVVCGEVPSDPIGESLAVQQRIQSLGLVG